MTSFLPGGGIEVMLIIVHGRRLRRWMLLPWSVSGPLSVVMPPSASQSDSAIKVKPLVWFVWLVILGALAYFIFKNVPRYFVFTAASYGNYFWAKATWLFPHVVCGVLAAVLGPLQFLPRMRRDYLPFHRVAGRVYVVAVLIGAIASVGMAAKVGSDDAAYAFGLIGLALAWVTTTVMAFVAIRRKNLPQHKQWMVRSYVVTFAFVTFRLVENMMKAGHIFPDHERGALLAWGCWAIPLLVTEVVLQAGAVFKTRV